jgi:hypothetical protein
MNYIQKQTDNNLCSPTYNQDRYINIGSCAPVYNIYVHQTCETINGECYKYDVYKNSNELFTYTKKQYYYNGSAQEFSGNLCNLNFSYTQQLGSTCINGITYTIYKNVNPCFTGNQWRTDDGTTYNYEPYIPAC